MNQAFDEARSSEKAVTGRYFSPSAAVTPCNQQTAYTGSRRLHPVGGEAALRHPMSFEVKRHGGVRGATMRSLRHSGCGP